MSRQQEIGRSKPIKVNSYEYIDNPPSRHENPRWPTIDPVDSTTGIQRL